MKNCCLIAIVYLVRKPVARDMVAKDFRPLRVVFLQIAPQPLSQVVSEFRQVCLMLNRLHQSMVSQRHRLGPGQFP